MDRQTETGQNRNIGYGNISFQTLQYPSASSGWRSAALPSSVSGIGCTLVFTGPPQRFPKAGDLRKTQIIYLELSP